MILFDYKCTSKVCGARFEALVLHGEDVITCPRCKHLAEKQLGGKPAKNPTAFVGSYPPPSEADAFMVRTMDSLFGSRNRVVAKTDLGNSTISYLLEHIPEPKAKA